MCLSGDCRSLTNKKNAAVVDFFDGRVLTGDCSFVTCGFWTIAVPFFFYWKAENRQVNLISYTIQKNSSELEFAHTLYNFTGRKNKKNREFSVGVSDCEESAGGRSQGMMGSKFLAPKQDLKLPVQSSETAVPLEGPIGMLIVSGIRIVS